MNACSCEGDTVSVRECESVIVNMSKSVDLRESVRVSESECEGECVSEREIVNGSVIQVRERESECME